MRVRGALLVMILLFSSAHATAQDFSAGPYLRASGSVAFDNFGEVVPASDGSDSDPVLGFNGSIGYRFTPHFALEVEGEWLDTFRVTGTAGPFLDEIAGDADLWVTTLNAKALYPMGRVHPFLAAGVGAMHARLVRSGESPTVSFRGKDTGTGFAGRAAAGFEVYVWQGLAVVVDGSYVFASGDVDGFDYVRTGWGLQYRF